MSEMAHASGDAGLELASRPHAADRRYSRIEVVGVLQSGWLQNAAAGTSPCASNSKLREDGDVIRSGTAILDLVFPRITVFAASSAR